MKPFHQWMSDMANSIEDASVIVKDENGEIVIKEEPMQHQTFADKYAKMYEGYEKIIGVIKKKDESDVKRYYYDPDTD